MLRMNFPDRRTRRSEDAGLRDALHRSLTIEQRLELCDTRPGESKKERARLAVAILLRDMPKPADTKREPAKQDKKAIKSIGRLKKTS